MAKNPCAAIQKRLKERMAQLQAHNKRDWAINKRESAIASRCARSTGASMKARPFCESTCAKATPELRRACHVITTRRQRSNTEGHAILDIVRQMETDVATCKRMAKAGRLSGAKRRRRRR